MRKMRKCHRWTFLKKKCIELVTSCDDRPDGCQLKPFSNEASFFLTK